MCEKYLYASNFLQIPISVEIRDEILMGKCDVEVVYAFHSQDSVHKEEEPKPQNTNSSEESSSSKVLAEIVLLKGSITLEKLLAPDRLAKDSGCPTLDYEIEMQPVQGYSLELPTILANGQVNLSVTLNRERETDD